mmetsp:Transcript_124631/g.399151  ORF Transcript_124631/g.399151 Transcript_124631/m.399151 type:complete len:215 (-) Transcript_124631:674-1318(-)
MRPDISRNTSVSRHSVNSEGSLARAALPKAGGNGMVSSACSLTVAGGSLADSFSDDVLCVGGDADFGGNPGDSGSGSRSVKRSGEEPPWPTIGELRAELSMQLPRLPMAKLSPSKLPELPHALTSTAGDIGASDTPATSADVKRLLSIRSTFSLKKRRSSPSPSPSSVPCMPIASDKVIPTSGQCPPSGTSRSGNSTMGTSSAKVCIGPWGDIN